MIIIANYEYHPYLKNSRITYYETAQSHPRKHYYSYTIGNGYILARSLNP